LEEVGLRVLREANTIKERGASSFGALDYVAFELVTST